MKGRILILLLLSIFLASEFSCKKDKDDDKKRNTDTAVYNPTAYTISQRAYFPKVNLNPNNPMTVEGVRLGRMLYYEKAIHRNQNLSCASCHLQAESFTSNVYENSLHILPHVNLAWSSNFLWYGGVQGTLEDAMRFEVNDFFGCNPDNLKNIRNYPYYFFKAFGSYEITNQKIGYALAQFIRTQISDNSKFDKWMAGEAALTAEEQRGADLFYSEKGDCFHCHSLRLLTDNDFHNIGLDSVYTGYNLGRYNVTGNPNDIGKFKTSSLRNIELHAPYMHDGRFATLEEVIEFYNKPTRPSATLDPIMTKPNHLAGLQLSEQDKKDLLAFLKCLTDSSFIHDRSLSSPF